MVGQCPRLEPGGKFSYDSYHVIRDASTATGTLFGKTDNGQAVFVRIPNFRMELPDAD